MTTNFQNPSVLYYPSIEFQDETWVKAALTIWDRIYRLVPEHYIPNDSDEIKKAIKAELIENIQLTTFDLEDTADSFIKFCKKIKFSPRYN